jgi:hypothetical protein
MKGRDDQYFYFSAVVIPADSTAKGRAKYFSPEQVRDMDLRGIPLYFEHNWVDKHDQRRSPFGVVASSRVINGSLAALVEMAPVPAERSAGLENLIRRFIIDKIVSRELRDVSLRHMAAKKQIGRIHLDLKRPLELSVTTDGELTGSSIAEWFWRDVSIQPGRQKAAEKGKVVAQAMTDVTMWSHSVAAAAAAEQQRKETIQSQIEKTEGKVIGNTSGEKKKMSAASATGAAPATEEKPSMADLMLADFATQGNIKAQELEKQLKATIAELEKTKKDKEIYESKAKEWDEVNNQRLEKLKSSVKKNSDFELEQAIQILKETADVDEASKRRLESLEKLKAEPVEEFKVENRGAEWAMGHDSMTRLIETQDALVFAHSRKAAVQKMRETVQAGLSLASTAGQKRAIETPSIAPGAAAMASSSSTSSSAAAPVSAPSGVPVPSLKRFKKMDEILGLGSGGGTVDQI